MLRTCFRSEGKHRNFNKPTREERTGEMGGIIADEGSASRCKKRYKSDVLRHRFVSKTVYN